MEVFRKLDFLLREHGSGTREVFDDAAARAGFLVEPLWEATSTTALVNAVVSGLGVAVLPLRMVRPAFDSGLVTMIVPEGLDLRRTFHLAWRREKFL